MQSICVLNISKCKKNTVMNHKKIFLLHYFLSWYKKEKGFVTVELKEET